MMDKKTYDDLLHKIIADLQQNATEELLIYFTEYLDPAIRAGWVEERARKSEIFVFQGIRLAYLDELENPQDFEDFLVRRGL